MNACIRNSDCDGAKSDHNANKSENDKTMRMDDSADLNLFAFAPWHAIAGDAGAGGAGGCALANADTRPALVSTSVAPIGCMKHANG